MQTWQELEPDIKITGIESLLARLGGLSVEMRPKSACRSLHRMIMHVDECPAIMIAESCLKSIYGHVCSSDNELGGLLIGRAFSLSNRGNHGYKFLTIVSNAIASLVYRNSPASLWMSTDLWNQAHIHLDTGKLVLGWYHSHPGIGVFFSGIDRLTQASFFRQAYSLGLVVDWKVREQRLFFGPSSTGVAFQVVAGAESLLSDMVTVMPDSSPPVC